MQSLKIRLSFSTKSAGKVCYTVHQASEKLSSTVLNTLKGEMMAELDFHTAGNLWCIWLEKVYTYCQPTLQETLLTLLAVLKWLTRPIIGNFEAFSGLNLALYRLRCSACIFNKCAPFPFLRRKKDEWFSPFPRRAHGNSL